MERRVNDSEWQSSPSSPAAPQPDPDLASSTTTTTTATALTKRPESVEKDKIIRSLESEVEQQVID
jgi:hypothetical protein